jgi:HK97 family phage major capsid protein
MDYTPPKTVREDVRASIARELSNYYAELAGSDDKPAPRFSMARVLGQMQEPHGLRDGYEREICAGAAISAGQSFDQHRVLIPLAALATRDLTATGGGSAGGYLVGTALASEPTDVLRPWSVVARAGMTILSGLRENFVIPRVVTASGGGWIAEGVAAPESQPVLGQAAMTPKHVATFVEFSRQWRIQSSDSGEALLRQQLLRAVGELVDVAVLAGSGASGQPTGLHLTPGIGTQSGSSLAHAGILNMRETVLTAGGQESNLRWIGTPAVQETLGARERASGGGRFLWDDNGILGKPAAATKNAPSAALTCGDFSAAVLGIWGSALRIEINPYERFASGGMSARVILTCDVAFPQPSAFCVATSIT